MAIATRVGFEKLESKYGLRFITKYLVPKPACVMMILMGVEVLSNGENY